MWQKGGIVTRVHRPVAQHDSDHECGQLPHAHWRPDMLAIHQLNSALKSMTRNLKLHANITMTITRCAKTSLAAPGRRKIDGDHAGTRNLVRIGVGQLEGVYHVGWCCWRDVVEGVQHVGWCCWLDVVAQVNKNVFLFFVHCNSLAVDRQAGTSKLKRIAAES